MLWPKPKMRVCQMMMYHIGAGSTLLETVVVKVVSNTGTMRSSSGSTLAMSKRTFRNYSTHTSQRTSHLPPVKVSVPIVISWQTALLGRKVAITTGLPTKGSQRFYKVR